MNDLNSESAIWQIFLIFKYFYDFISFSAHVSLVLQKLAFTECYAASFVVSPNNM